MQAKVRFIFIILSLILGLNSCFKKETYPSVPVVEFNDFILYGQHDSATFILNFTDGEGDIGLLESDTLAPYNKDGENYNNLFLYYFEKDDSLGWVPGKVNGVPIVFSFRVDPVLPYDKSKGIKGTITYAFGKVQFYNPFSANADTIKYQFQLVDRALNYSNLGETDPIYITF
ncbi:hypothetical protein DNU06_00435 [Putridiphycobacter roseus]|uniref:Uncharacterized protein n=1 Tax=Putridiphycobacter roseus TaxID=2219161 RepID=A0A2W1NKE2_9FLAO|nr:hypothetical protein [Putridiphycobacter roseus]PZE18336.1 hypothetical protein DNU06_00435 [Putridiphycobacter roseus]